MAWNLPDGCTPDQIERNQADESEAMLTYRSELERVLVVCSHAWQRFPHQTEEDALKRLPPCMDARREADKVLKRYVMLTPEETKKMQAELGCAREANWEHDVHAFKQSIEEYLGCYRRAIEIEEDNAKLQEDRDK